MTRHRIIISLLVFAMVLGVAPVARAASFSILPVSASIEPGETFSVDIKIDSQDSSINAAQAEILFPSDLLELTNINRTGSVFSFWLVEPALSAGGNSVEFIGGTPKGVSGSSLQVLRLSFRARTSGSASLVFSDAAITASDGTGTNVLSFTTGASIQLGALAVPSPSPTISPQEASIPPTPAPEVPEVVQRSAVRATGLPQQPSVRVPLYPDSSQWYNHLGEVIILWEVPDDVTRVATELDQNPNTEPKDVESQLSTGKRLGILTEGIWYIHVQFRNNIGWGPIAHYRIALDTTAPVPFDATIDNVASDNPQPEISLDAADSLSGVKEIAALVDGQPPFIASASPFLLPLQKPGSYHVVVRVTDFAGNSRQDDISFEILPLPTPRLDFVTGSIIQGEEAFTSGSTLPTIFVDVLVSDEDDFIVFRGEAMSDANGSWNLTFGESLPRGRYTVTATARDSRGAVSFPTDAQELRVRSAPVISIGPLDLGWVELVVMVLSLGLAGSGFVAWSAAQRRSRRAAYNTIAIRDMEKMNALVRRSLAAIDSLVHGEKRVMKQRTMTEFEMFLKKAQKASDDMSQYVAGTVRKSGK